MVEGITGNKVVGVKQATKVLKTGKCKTLYLAKDANLQLLEDIIVIAKSNSINIVYIDTMKELGSLCGIDVKASCAATTL